MSETAWERTKRYSGTAYNKALKPTYNKALKPGFDKAWKAVDKLGAPINRLSNKVGAEAFWPTTLDKESDKAARILRSFCSMCITRAPVSGGVTDAVRAEDGFYQEEVKDTPEGIKQKQRVIKKIPT